MIHRAAWATPFHRMYVGALEVVALSSAFELWKEAWSMHHCADKFADRCAKCGLLIASIRKTGRTRPLATAALRRDDEGWSLEAITGFANALASDEAVRAALETLERLNERDAAAVAAQAAR